MVEKGKLLNSFNLFILICIRHVSHVKIDFKIKVYISDALPNTLLILIYHLNSHPIVSMYMLKCEINVGQHLCQMLYQHKKWTTIMPNVVKKKKKKNM